MSHAKIISFATQKGGVGKSTLLMLTASALHNRTDKKILVIDSDSQKSVKDIYKQENSDLSYDVYAFNWAQPKPEINFQKTIAVAEKKYDLILIDVPGKLKGKEIYYSLLISDIVMVPIVASILDLNATIKFLQSLPDIREEKERLGFDLKVYGVVNKRDKSVEYNQLKQISGIGGLELFYSSLSSLVRYKRDISTFRDIVESDAKDEFNTYFDEFMTKCIL